MAHTDAEVLKSMADEDLGPDDQRALAELLQDAPEDAAREAWQDPKVKAQMAEAGKRAVAAAHEMARQDEIDRMNDHWTANPEAR